MGPAHKAAIGTVEALQSSVFSTSPYPLRAAFDASPDPLLLVENGHVLLANSAAAKLFDCEPAQFDGQPLGDYLLLDRRFCRDMLEAPTPYECQHPSCEKTIHKPSGEELTLEVRCSQFQTDGRKLLLVLLRDIGARDFRRTLRDDQLRFRAIFDGAAIGIATATLDGRILEANPAFSAMLGYSTQELAGMHARELHPGDFEKDESLLRELLDGMRNAYQLEKEFRRKNGTYVWGHLSVSLVRNAQNQPAFLIAMIEDTSARKLTEEHLRNAEKMEVIGRLAGSVAHDFNNLLTGILLYTDLLLNGLPKDNPLRTHAQEIRGAAEQGSALTQQLLHIARKDAPKPRIVDLNAVVASMKNLLRRLIGEQIQLQADTCNGACNLIADPAQLRQIILNLTLNARDAMPAGGKITISTKQTAGPIAAVSLAVEDTGCGMDAETRAHLFEPFFTTKEAGHGTGLGLATVKRIVDELNGNIEVESEIGHGTKFKISLPLAN